MVITPKQTVTVNGATYNAGTRYRVNYTTGNAIVAAGGLSPNKPTPVVDPEPEPMAAVPELEPAPKPQRKRTRKTTKTIEP